MTSKKHPSFYAIISDIHGNIDALEAVLTDIEDWPVRGILCLGDIVGYGPEPAACVQRIMESCVLTVSGNHEAMLFLAGQSPAVEFGASVGEPIAMALRQLNDEQMTWIGDLPVSADLPQVTLSHSSLHEPQQFHYIHSTEEAKAHFAARKSSVSFQGHTHVPVIWESKNNQISCFTTAENLVRLAETSRYAINVGSVGQPRDGDPRAGYALYDDDSHLLLHRRVEYNIARAQSRFKKAKLPERNSTRLKGGQ